MFRLRLDSNTNQDDRSIGKRLRIHSGRLRILIGAGSEPDAGDRRGIARPGTAAGRKGEAGGQGQCVAGTGNHPSAVARVREQLQAKDKEAFDKLSSKVLSKLNADNLTASREADNMAMNLLRPGPRPAENSTGSSSHASTTANATTTPNTTKVSN